MWSERTKKKTHHQHYRLRNPYALAYLVRRLVVTVRSGLLVALEEYARRVLGTGERVCDLAVSGEHRQREQHDQHPRDEYGGGSIALGAHVYGGDRVDDGQEPVQRHEYQGIDARVCGNHDQVLNHFAPDVAEWPVRQHVVDGGKRHTEHYEQ